MVTGRSGTIGNVFYIEERFWPHNTTLYIKDFKGNVPKFIFYLIQKLRFDRYFAGTTIPTLNRNDVHKIWVAMPEPPEQRAIITVVDLAEKLCALRQRTDLEVERIRTSLIQHLFTGRIRLPVDSTARKGE